MTTNTPKTPCARWGHVLHYDPHRENVLLFGGVQADGGLLNDTWTWNGVSWQQYPVEAPPARGFAAAAFHPAQGAILLHGGRGEDATFSDTWVWNGQTWQQLNDQGPFQADHHQLVLCC